MTDTTKLILSMVTYPIWGPLYYAGVFVREVWKAVKMIGWEIKDDLQLIWEVLTGK